MCIILYHQWSQAMFEKKPSEVYAEIERKRR